MELNGAFCRFWGHQTSKIAKSRQSYSNDYLPIICLFYSLARASMYDVAYEFAYAVRMRRNKRERP